MNETIKNFATQFSWEPQIENGPLPANVNKFILAGMGGSHLNGDLLLARDPSLNLIIHSDYGLPPLSKAGSEKYLLIASSYSGNTEETIDAYNEALKNQISTIAITTGGQLLKLAQEKRAPYIQLPSIGIQPRMALGFSTKALAKAMDQENLVKELSQLAQIFEPAKLETPGQELAGRLKNRVPVIYASARNRAVAYNWKIKLNETGKIPAFYNILPEMNHNEMTGFDVKKSTSHLSNIFYFLFLTDSDDHPRVQQRMSILQKLYQDRGLTVETLKLAGQNRWQQIFDSLLLADWTSFYIAQNYGLEADQVPMVEEFKRLIK
ncbi:MAG: bifunctional phosphoglucose/phosphomannose isomerase [Candidatus Jacksonbacteria bacterium RIFOXYC2_FULL_44_29]|nr:MAG: Bifunctional phosphoglucose/phosphomannose isomerase [Parcubacteria group bacterium GW2011_GWC2_44_22]OGY74761.1 MAG: bifunctional phosphoglucose/phosphomannose isomerase [Candidatus Jacksonbacteria bacterium RIFOXYA2_FULL_43_12]OGY75428.1 MAG: bifunctional phosphoglucose/phosphomannose isomerase [Candidatus Jacksonbacteria bacterium RIFOXYB2_FULL_44_15]OGY77512.1 MAG: bifunctional phosphoglucose/phosphomannose isomerase [Candidatus Jacksonbacteria bacterium RIFOXYC2_FULL_44_29]OGY79887